MFKTCELMAVECDKSLIYLIKIFWLFVIEIFISYWKLINWIILENYTNWISTFNLSGGFTTDSIIHGTGTLLTVKVFFLATFNICQSAIKF